MKRVIIAGGRDFDDADQLDAVCSSLLPADAVVLSGTARGADTMGADWANCNYLPVEEYPADWDAHGKAAGYVRNALMASKADTLIAFWDGVSKGTEHMIDIALGAGLEVHVYRYSK
jgi:hypothetical protein